MCVVIRWPAYFTESVETRFRRFRTVIAPKWRLANKLPGSVILRLAKPLSVKALSAKSRKRRSLRIRYSSRSLASLSGINPANATCVFVWFPPKENHQNSASGSRLCFIFAHVGSLYLRVASGGRGSCLTLMARKGFLSPHLARFFALQGKSNGH